MVILLCVMERLPLPPFNDRSYALHRFYAAARCGGQGGNHQASNSRFGVLFDCVHCGVIPLEYEHDRKLQLVRIAASFAGEPFYFRAASL